MNKTLFFSLIVLLNYIIQSDNILNAQSESWDAIYSSETSLVINESKSGAKHTEKGRYIILNEKGLKFSKLSFSYGFNSKIVSVSASIKRFNGSIIRKVNKSDFNDFNVQSDVSLYTDTRIKSIDLQHFQFPYIIEYQVERKITNNIIYPGWWPKMDYKLLNLSSTFSLSANNPDDITIYERNLARKETVQKKHLTIYKWKVDSLLPIADESYSYSEYWDSPRVLSAPRIFNLEYPGGNTNWEEFGDWTYKLNEGRDILTHKEIQTVDSLLLLTENEFQQIDILYKYLQNNTRYVSIQEGIGGWQPFEASFVCEKKYGDCKALTNYMLALLKHAGIKSYYTLIKAGINTSDIITDFPSNQFNHAILMVPFQSDTIWLDCTSKLTPTGFVEKFIADRHALVIDEKKSYLVKTPTYDTLQNTEHINGIIKINADLTGNGTITFRKYAHRSIGSRSMNKYYNSNTREKILKREINLPSFIILADEHREKVENFIPLIIDSVNLKIDIAGKKAGEELFLSYPLSMNIRDIKLEDRKTDIYISDSYSRIDSMLYILPECYKLTTQENFKFDSEFGNLIYSILPNGNEILFVISYSLIKGRYPKEQIHEFKKLIESIIKIEYYEIIVSKNE